MGLGSLSHDFCRSCALYVVHVNSADVSCTNMATRKKPMTRAFTAAVTFDDTVCVTMIRRRRVTMDSCTTSQEKNHVNNLPCPRSCGGNSFDVTI